MKAIRSKPQIRKLGTLDRDMVETTPLVINDRLYRFEFVRSNYWKNTTGASYFRFVDVETGQFTPAFARGHEFGSAHNENGVIYVFGVTKGGGDTIKVFRSVDLINWEEKVAFHLPGWEIFNNSVCRGADGFVMAFEIGAPADECGRPFTNRFAVSQDLWDWNLTAPDAVYAKDRYTACPVIRFLPETGLYYMIYLEMMTGWGLVPYIACSPDLIRWQRSQVNPVLMFDDFEDKKLANPHLPPAEQDRIADALDINNSDVDLCEFQGRTIIYYSWGNQTGVEFLAEAVYEGSLAEFLQGFFGEWEGGMKDQ